MRGAHQPDQAQGRGAGEAGGVRGQAGEDGHHCYGGEGGQDGHIEREGGGQAEDGQQGEEAE